MLMLEVYHNFGRRYERLVSGLVDLDFNDLKASGQFGPDFREEHLCLHPLPGYVDWLSLNLKVNAVHRLIECIVGAGLQHDQAHLVGCSI